MDFIHSVARTASVGLLVYVGFCWLESLEIFSIWNWIEISRKSPQIEVKPPDSEPEPKTFSDFEYPQEIGHIEGQEDKYSSVCKQLGWIENVGSSRFKSWLCLQTAATKAYFSKHESIRQTASRTMLFNSQIQVGIPPFKRGNRYFQFKRTSEERQFVLFTSVDSLELSTEALNPGVISLTQVASSNSSSTAADSSMSATFEGVWVCDDGTLMAYAVSRPDQTTCTILIRDSETLQDLADVISGCDLLSNVAWARSSRGFFYLRRDAGSDGQQQVAFHRVGRTQASDATILEVPADCCIHFQVTVDQRFLVLELFRVAEVEGIPTCYTAATGNQVYTIDIMNFDGKSSESIGEVTELISSSDYRFEFIVNVGNTMWFRTNYKCPNFKVVKICVDSLNSVESSSPRRSLQSAMDRAVDCLSEDTQGAILESAQICNRSVLVVRYMLHASHMLLLYDFSVSMAHPDCCDKEEWYLLERPIAQLPHDSFGTVCGPNCHFYSEEIFYSHNSFSNPGTNFRAIVRERRGKIEIAFDPPSLTAVPGVDPFVFETKQEFAMTSDGTPIPLYIFGAKSFFDSQPNSSPRPCILYVCGGFGVSVLPAFSTFAINFVRMTGGLFCVANVRGGGEYGSSWHRQGSGLHKETGESDVVRVAEYLIENEYTTQKSLGLYSGSIGSALVGNCLNRRPWLFRAAVIEDGLFDLMGMTDLQHTLEPPTDSDLADHPSPSDLTSRWLWEFGSFATNTGIASRIHQTSPLHGISNKELPYPALLLVVSSQASDPTFGLPPRQHSFKYIAALQHVVGARAIQKRPLLLLVQEEVANSSEVHETDILTFFVSQLNI